MPEKTLINSHSRKTSVFLTVLMAFLLAFLILGGNKDNPRMMAAGAVYMAFLTVITYLIFRTGMVGKYRSIFFATYAVGFSLSFIPMLIETRGSMFLSGEEILSLSAPLCHLTLPMIAIPAVVYGFLIFPTKLFSEMGFFPMLYLWLGATLFLGRGWCSWGCFYGGVDEFFSKLLPKKIISSKNFNYTLRFFPYAFLLVIMLWAFIALEPVYCTWFCPFKAITEFIKPTNWLMWVQTGIFVSIFLGLVVVLPLLMKRRTQCGLFCPFGAFQAVIGQVNPYRVKIDGEKCTKCNTCVQQCPTFSLTEDAVSKGKSCISCTRCGKCMDVCPRGAIQYSLIGVPLRKGQDGGGFISEVFRPDTLFIFGALLFGGVLSSGMVSTSLLRITNLAVNGSFLLK